MQSAEAVLNGEPHLSEVLMAHFPFEQEHSSRILQSLSVTHLRATFLLNFSTFQTVEEKQPLHNRWKVAVNPILLQ